MTWVATVGRLVELVGGRHDGALLWVPPGDLPERLGVLEPEPGVLIPVRSATARLILHPGAPVYLLTTPASDGTVRYVLTRPATAPGQP